MVPRELEFVRLCRLPHRKRDPLVQTSTGRGKEARISGVLHEGVLENETPALRGAPPENQLSLK